MVRKYCFYFVFLSAAAVFFNACAGGKTGNVTEEDSLLVEDDSLAETSDSLILLEEQPVSVRADELFNDFFYNFISDVKFQRLRTDYPMKKHKGSIFGHFSTRDFFTVIFEHRKDLALLKDTTLRKVSVEWIYLDSLNVDRFNFWKVDGEWLLIDRTESSLVDSPNADFFRFYDRFVNDTIAQIDAIGDGVTFTVEAQEGDEEVDSIVTPDVWTEFMSDKPVLSPVLVNIDYGQKVEDGDNRDLLFQGFSNGVSIEFRFRREDGQWFLNAIEL